MKLKKWLGVCIIIFIFGCSSGGNNDDTITNPDGGNEEEYFNRKEILTNWADNFILPYYEEYVATTANLKFSASTFTESGTIESLNALRIAFRTSYLTLQKVSMFEIGMAEQIQLRNFTNIYPTNTTKIDAKTAGDDYNLELPSSFAEQGFPALDYLLYGTGATDEEVLAYFSKHSKANQYLEDVAERIDLLANQILENWKNGYRDTFINNDSDAVTASFNKMANAYILYYERFLRSGKIGIPAGALSGQKNADKVEAYYTQDFSKELFLQAVYAAEKFYNGIGKSGQSGASLFSALSDLNQKTLAEDIEEQFVAIRTAGEKLNDNFSLEVETNNEALITIRDLLQVNTILFKNDMISALNITISYVDNDGD